VKIKKKYESLQIPCTVEAITSQGAPRNSLRCSSINQHTLCKIFYCYL